MSTSAIPYDISMKCLFKKLKYYYYRRVRCLQRTVKFVECVCIAEHKNKSNIYVRVAEMPRAIILNANFKKLTKVKKIKNMKIKEKWSIRELI